MAISAPDYRVRLETLVSAVTLAEDEQTDDIAEEDAERDRIILNAENEIMRRLETVGDDYPFRVDDKGRALRFIAPLSEAGTVYVFCLFLSQAFDRTIVLRKGDAPHVTNKVRDLFQACATVAAGGYVRGPAISFGSPRPDRSGFLNALKRAYKLFGDGTPHVELRPAAPRSTKDCGIDIIAWRRAPDGLPGTQYLLAQVASGADWIDKSIIPDRENFHRYWFERIPGSTPTDGMFMPFALEPEIVNDSIPYREILIDHMQGKCHKFGLLFYRDRVAFHFAQGVRLISAGESGIERYDELPKIVEWVDNYSKRLRKG